MGSLRGKLTVEDCISMDETVDLGASLAQLGLGGGPLLPLSPNAMPCGGGKAPTEACARGAAKDGAPSLALDEGSEGDDGLGALPSFRSPARGGRGRRPDPRRQSLALSSMFAAATAGAGLLDDSEIAVGDEDVQIPLAKSSKLLNNGHHSMLWVDPDVDELLDSELPEPAFPAGGTTGGGAGALPAIPEAAPGATAEPLRCASPVLPKSTARARAAAAAAPTPPGRGVRDSVAIDDGLSRACAGQQGLDDLDDADFQLADGNRVKEMALLFKMTGAAGGAGGGGAADGAAPAASAPAAVPAAAGACQQQQQQQQQQHAGKEGLARQGDADLSAIRERLRQFQEQAGEQQQPMPAAAEPPNPAPAPAPAEAQPAAAAAAPSKRSAAGTRPASSRLPAPPARPSRLRQPSSSNSYFSSSATGSAHAGGRPGVAGSSAAIGAVPPRRPAATVASTAAPPTASVSSAKAAPVRTRVAQASTRIPTPTKGTPRAAERTVLCPPRAIPSRLNPAAGGGAARTPTQALRLAAEAGAPTPGPRAWTPTTARLRMLEANPELAFGGGARLADSPALGEHEGPRKLSAEERHYAEWQDHL